MVQDEVYGFQDSLCLGERGVWGPRHGDLGAFFQLNGLLPKSLFAWSKTLFDKSKTCSRRFGT
jgi:hypothetical protein